MKDIEIGCDSEHGGVLCNRCGDNSRNNGAVGLTHQADSLIDDSRQTLETKIYEARKFIDTLPEGLVDRARDAADACRAMFTRQINDVNGLVGQAENVERVINFLANEEKTTTPSDILSSAAAVLNYDPVAVFGNPAELDEFWKKQLKFFNPQGRQSLSNDSLSKYYEVARDSKLNFNKVKMFLEEVDESLKTITLLAAAGSGVNPEELANMKSELRLLLDTMRRVIPSLRSKCDIDSEFSENYRRYTNNLKLLHELTKRMRANLQRLDKVYEDYEAFKHDNDIDGFIAEAAKFESIELRSVQLVKNVDSLHDELREYLNNITSLKEKADFSREEMAERLAVVKDLTQKAKDVRSIIHEKHNIECPSLYA